MVLPRQQTHYRGKTILPPSLSQDLPRGKFPMSFFILDTYAKATHGIVTGHFQHGLLTINPASELDVKARFLVSVLLITMTVH